MDAQLLVRFADHCSQPFSITDQVTTFGEVYIGAGLMLIFILSCYVYINYVEPKLLANRRELQTSQIT